ncbi:APC family permease [Streptomyces phyllanthi]|nr:APC family permease [Streptomyces phyllanthi]
MATTGEPIAVDPGSPSSADGATGKQLRGKLGTRDLIFSAIALAAPLSATTGYVSINIAYGNGLGTPTTFLVITVALALFAVAFGGMAQYVERPGSFYAYICAGLGKPIGLGASFLTLLAYAVLSLGFYGYAGVATAAFVVREGGPDVQWWVWSLLFWAIVGTLGYLRIDISAKVLGVALFVEVLVVLIFDAVVFAKGGPEGVSATVFTPDEFFSGQVGLALVLAILFFVGFESTAIYRDETSQPGKTISRASIISVVLIGVFYTITSWAVITGLGTSQAVKAVNDDLAGSFFTVSERYISAGFNDVTSVLLLTSIAASHLGLQNMMSRYVFNLAKDGILPKPLAAVHGRHDSPHIASLTTSGAMLLGAGVMAALGMKGEEVYSWFAGASSAPIAFALSLTSLAALVYFARVQSSAAIWRYRISAALATAFLLLCVTIALLNLPSLMGGSAAFRNGTLLVFSAVFIVGVAFAVALRGRRPEIYARIGREEA